MYEKHFGLQLKPFALTPDPGFLYPSRRHSMALTMLEYGLVSQASFSVLTGDIGSGKTTLVRRLLRRLGNKVAVGLINNTHTGFDSIHGWALSALSIAPVDDSPIAQYEALVDSFAREYAAGRRTLLILDEAQNLSVEVLEELRLLSNVNSEKSLMLQVLLVGQPELRRKLALPELRQFAQRISVDYHLTPLSREETHAYVLHRLRVAGREEQLFMPDALEFIHARSGGVPRLINRLADMAMVYAFADRLQRINADLIAHVLRDRSGGKAPPAGAATAAPVRNGGVA